MSTKQLWDKVRLVCGSTKKSNDNSPNISSEQLNKHYAEISTDKHYIQPTKKSISNVPDSIVDEFEVFMLLDKLRPTSCRAGRNSTLVSARCSPIYLSTFGLPM